MHSHFGGPEVDYASFDYAGTADEALTQLDEAYAAWTAGVRGLGRGGPRASPAARARVRGQSTRASTLVLHINRELIHHGAEIALLRDLYAHRND